MQHLEEIKSLYLFALSNVPLAQRVGTASAAENNASTLRFAVLVESLKETGFCIVEEGVEIQRLCSLVGFMQLPKVSEDGRWHLGGLHDILCSFNVFFLLSNDLDKSEWAFIWGISQRPDATDQ